LPGQSRMPAPVPVAGTAAEAVIAGARRPSAPCWRGRAGGCGAPAAGHGPRSGSWPAGPAGPGGGRTCGAPGSSGGRPGPGRPAGSCRNTPGGCRRHPAAASWGASGPWPAGAAPAGCATRSRRCWPWSRRRCRPAARPWRTSSPGSRMLPGRSWRRWAAGPPPAARPSPGSSPWSAPGPCPGPSGPGSPGPGTRARSPSPSPALLPQVSCDGREVRGARRPDGTSLFLLSAALAGAARRRLRRDRPRRPGNPREN
jgi:hypothetical protein